MSAPAASAGPRVWAPQAERVQIELADGSRHPAKALEGHRPGWWLWDQAPDGPYRWVLDGAAHPDPRSAWQPEGPDGPSHTVRHESFRWTDQQWRGRPLGSCVIYECHVGTFSPQGDYAGVLARLDHLCQLGVGAIELMPLNTFPGRHGWGYDGVCWFAPHPAYGPPEQLAALVDGCHARGLAVIVDVVYNHMGPSGNHLWAYGPYFTDNHHTPWGPALNVDGPDSDEVRRYVTDNVEHWIRHYHFDGFRLDATHAIVDHSAKHLLEEMAERVQRLSLELDRTIWLIAENEANDPRLVTSREAGGLGLDGQWSDDLHHALHVSLTGERDGYYADFDGLRDVAKALTGVFVRDGDVSPSLRRRHGRAIGDLPHTRFVTALQNHDQIGNRACGDRLGTLVGGERQRIGAVVALLAPTVPLIFQGEEWAAGTPFLYFTDHVDADLATAVSEGRRREFAAFGWQPEQVPDPQAPATFQASVLRWDELEDPAHGSMLQWYRDLLALRRHHGLAGATVHVVEVTDGALTLRLGERGQLLVALNLGPGEHRSNLAAVSADPGCCELSVIMSAGSVTVGDAPAVGANRYRIAAPLEGQSAVPITLGVNAVAVFEIDPVEGTQP